MKLLKKIKKADLFFAIVLLILFFIRLPSIMDSYKIEGMLVGELKFIHLNLPPEKLTQKDSKKILVFWATWCGPCKIEMYRFNQAIKNKELHKEQVIFINMQESVQTIKKFLYKNDFDLTIALDQNSKLSRMFKITSTPTIVYINRMNIVHHVATGLSPLLIFRATWFLDKRS